MTTEELQKMILGLLQMEDTKPQEAISALGQSLLLVLLGSCEMENYSEEIAKSTLGFLDKIKKTLMDEINKHVPEDERYFSLEELRAETEAMSERLSENEADRKSRVNACMQIMEVDTLGFLLLSYMKNGNVSLCSNLRDEEMTDKVLTLMRETLYNGDSQVKKV